MNDSYTLFKNPGSDRNFLMLFVLVFVPVTWIHTSNPLVYYRFLGDFNPVFIFLLSGILGYACLLYLEWKFQFSTLKKLTLRSSLIAVAGGFAFGSIIIGIDLGVRLPEDLNVEFPASLLFYPTIGFIAEIAFQVIPFTLMAIGLHKIYPNLDSKKALQIAFIFAACAEPLYQVITMHQTNQYKQLTLIIIGIHILWISLFQLFVFKRYGFFPMFLFRLVYYLIWHIGWGYLRLQVF